GRAELHRRGPVIGARVVVVEVHVPGLPAVTVVDGDVAAGGAPVAHEHHHPVGGGVHLGALRGHQVVALVAVAGSSRSPAGGELVHLRLQGEGQLEVGGRRGGEGEGGERIRDRHYGRGEACGHQ